MRNLTKKNEEYTYNNFTAIIRQMYGFELLWLKYVCIPSSVYMIYLTNVLAQTKQNKGNWESEGHVPEITFEEKE